MGYIDKILEYFIQSKSSDLHLSVGKRPKMRKNTNMVDIDRFRDIVEEKDIDTFIKERQPHKTQEWGEIKREKIYSMDSSLTFNNRRFRLHMYRSTSGIVFVFRVLQENIPTIQQLNLPEQVNKLKAFNKGLILVTGATGSGKSTTLASILNEINNTKRKAIITVEDPIEYIYNESLSRIEQREIGMHVESFESATKDMMREDPDIILVGEMRDISTIRNTITLSETGHLVLSTLHTKSVTDSIDRMVDVFPAEQQQQVRVQLSFVLIGILNQTLISNTHNQVIPLCELMMNDSVVASMIRQAKCGNNLKDYIRSSKNGSLHIIDNAAWHIENGRLTLEECCDILEPGDISVLRTILEDRKVAGVNKGQGNIDIRESGLNTGVQSITDESHIKQIGARFNGKRRF